MNIPGGLSGAVAGDHTAPTGAWLMAAARTRRRTGRLFHPCPLRSEY